MDDIRAVMDAVGSERALLFAVGDGGMVSVLFAAWHPDRTLGLVLWNPEPHQTHSDDYQWGWTNERWDARAEKVEATWGSLEFAEGELRQRWRRTSRSTDRRSSASLAFSERSRALVLRRRWRRSYGVPTSQRFCPRCRSRRSSCIRPSDSVGPGRYTASMIPGQNTSKSRRQSGCPSGPARIRSSRRSDGSCNGSGMRRRSSIACSQPFMFTDIVGSTSKTADAWRSGMEGPRRATPRRRSGPMLRRYPRLRGRHGGRRLLGHFDGPARGVRCAMAIARAVRAPWAGGTCGVHTGEVELAATVRGVAVNIGARIAAGWSPEVSCRGPSRISSSAPTSRSRTPASTSLRKSRPLAALSGSQRITMRWRPLLFRPNRRAGQMRF